MNFLTLLSPEQKWLSQEDAMAKTGLKRTTLYKLRNLHKVKWSQIGRKVFYLNKSLDELLDNNSSEFDFKTKHTNK
ncbi:MAG: helix-turn-helix domain-containing protein [Saprospiraceae bacterium]|nr:helix-turn-helix domain-containing protein [Candidatus Vicinibacter proximus]